MQLATAMLAYADNMDRAAEFTQTQLDYAANVSFAAYALVYLASAVLFLILIHILCFVRPDAKNRRECNTKLADAVERFAMTSGVTAQLLDANSDWHARHDARLSRWESQLPPPQPPNISPLPHGV